MGSLKIRVGAAKGGNVQDVIQWLEDHVGKLGKTNWPDGSDKIYLGSGWMARRVVIASGWFLDVTFEHEADAIMFALRWK